MKRVILAVTVVLVLSSSSLAHEITIGSFNLKWFGHGFNPRDGHQIAVLANFIRALEVDILVCQEIHPTGDTSGNDTADWKDLLSELGDGFDGWVGQTGASQHLAFIWRTDRVQPHDVGEMAGISREVIPESDEPTFPRIPITAYVKSRIGGVDFRIIAVHLYESEDTARYAEATNLNAWVAAYLSQGHDSDLVIIGDCNTKSMGSDATAPSTTIACLEAGGILTCISKDHCEYTTPTSQQRYEHAFLTPGFLEEFIEGSWDVRREVVDTYPELYQSGISDHIPVVFRVHDEDNDSTPMGNWTD